MHYGKVLWEGDGALWEGDGVHYGKVLWEVMVWIMGR